MPDIKNQLEAVSDTDDDKIASKVQAYYNQDYSYKRPYILAWEETLRFFEGDQYIRPGGEARDWERIPTPSRRFGYMPRPRSNYVFKVVRALSSNLLKNLPKGEVRPRSNRDEHRRAARIANKVLESIWEINQEDEKYIDLVMWLTTTGTCFKKDFVDYSEAAKLQLPSPSYVETPDGVPLTDFNGNPVLPRYNSTSDENPLLCLQSEIISPFQVSVDYTATSLDSAQWVMEYSVHPLSWVREQFSVEGPGYTGRGDEVQPNQDFNPALIAWYRMKQLTGYFVRGNEMEGDNVVVIEYYERPTKERKAGRTVIVANGVPLYIGDSPYMPKFWHPYTLFKFNPFPGRIWGMTPAEQILPLQRKINSIDVFMMVYRQTMLAPKILMPKGSGIPRDHWTGSPGQILEYSAGSPTPPIVLPSPPLSGDIWKEREIAKNDIEEVAGTYDILGGDRPVGVPSYSGLAFLQENANDAHRITHIGFEKSMERSETKKLQLVAMFYTRNRSELTEVLRSKLADMPGEDISSFVGADLMDNVDVRIEVGASIPRSRTLYQQTAMEFMKSGLLPKVMGNPETYQDFLNLFGLGDFGSTDSEDVEKAENENAMMLKMEDANQVLSPSDNDYIHLQIHDRERKSIRFFSRNPMVQQLFQVHIQLHQQSIMQKQMQAPAAAQGQQVQAQLEAGQMMPGSRGQMRPMGMATGAMRGNEPGPAGEPPV